jgi:hypothetical protein
MTVLMSPYLNRGFTMKSVWIEAELRRQGSTDPERLRQALGAIGNKVSMKALSLMPRDVSGAGLAAYVRQIMPA